MPEQDPAGPRRNGRSNPRATPSPRPWRKADRCIPVQGHPGCIAWVPVAINYPGVHPRGDREPTTFRRRLTERFLAATKSLPAICGPGLPRRRNQMRSRFAFPWATKLETGGHSGGLERCGDSVTLRTEWSQGRPDQEERPQAADDRAVAPASITCASTWRETGVRVTHLLSRLHTGNGGVLLKSASLSFRLPHKRKAMTRPRSWRPEGRSCV